MQVPSHCTRRGQAALRTEQPAAAVLCHPSESVRGRRWKGTRVRLWRWIDGAGNKWWSLARGFMETLGQRRDPGLSGQAAMCSGTGAQQNPLPRLVWRLWGVSCPAARLDQRWPEQSARPVPTVRAGPGRAPLCKATSGRGTAELARELCGAAGEQFAPQLTCFNSIYFDTDQKRNEIVTLIYF